MAKIRRGSRDDLEAVRAIGRDAYVIYVPRIGREPAPMVQDFAAALSTGRLWVAGAPIAEYVVAFPRDDHWQLENVAVAVAARGRGVGRSLIAFVKAMARDTGAAAVELYTNARMTENLALYPRLGYLETGRRTEDGFDRVFFRKTLSPRSGDGC